MQHFEWVCVFSGDKVPSFSQIFKKTCPLPKLLRIPGWRWGEDNGVGGVGMHNGRFYESSLWNYPPRASKDFMKLNLSSKRIGLVKQSLESTRGLNSSMLTPFLSCKISQVWNQRKGNHHLIFLVDFDFIHSMLMQMTGKMDISS